VIQQLKDGTLSVPSSINCVFVRSRTHRGAFSLIQLKGFTRPACRSSTWFAPSARACGTAIHSRNVVTALWVDAAINGDAICSTTASFDSGLYLEAGEENCDENSSPASGQCCCRLERNLPFRKNSGQIIIGEPQDSQETNSSEP
jgi:hypothetical protein